MPRTSPPGELSLIDRIRHRAGGGNFAVRLGIGDDCAILRPPRGCEIVVTTDFSLEGRHFRRDWHSPQSIGHRTLARGLSDLAAMGAKPLAAFLSLALPTDLARNTLWLDGFLDGLLGLAAAHNVPLAGGDTAQSPSEEVLADIILIGATPTGRALRRSTAKPGDALYVTGALGGAAAELATLAEDPQTGRLGSGFPDPGTPRAVQSLAHPHCFPQPRLATGQALLQRGLATAAIDLSDGLSTDLMHLAGESRVAAEIDAAALPLHPLTRELTPRAALAAALHGGEDYELLFTARPSAKVPRRIAGVPVTRIGRIVPARKGRPQVMLLGADGRREPLTPQGWEHFR